MSASRREARERALGLLYEAEARGVDPAAVLEALPVPPDPYAIDLVVGVGDDQETIDELIRRFAKDWKLERMPAIDRAVLRMAIHELMSCHEVPTGVAISEAVELATQYSTDESGRFVNGMLSGIAAEVRPDS
ncbi:MAG: transcription antitermination factor NusB [Acidimicrobiales bacterium]